MRGKCTAFVGLNVETNYFRVNTEIQIMKYILAFKFADKRIRECDPKDIHWII